MMDDEERKQLELERDIAKCQGYVIAQRLVMEAESIATAGCDWNKNKKGIKFVQQYLNDNKVKTLRNSKRISLNDEIERLQQIMKARTDTLFRERSDALKKEKEYKVELQKLRCELTKLKQGDR